MSQLLAEIGLRLAKAGAAALVGLVLWFLVTGVFGASPSVELALLCWISGGAFIVLVETSPI